MATRWVCKFSLLRRSGLYFILSFLIWMPEMTTRAQPREIVALNGSWQLEPGAQEQPPSVWTHVVPVPALVDVAEPAYKWEDYDFHWYRTTFTVPSTQRRSGAFLKLEQSMFGTVAWLNGQYLGGDIACYTSQEYCVDKALRYDQENELLVRVGAKKTLPPESAVGNDFERLSFIPGIWGDVSLILHDSPRIKLVQTIPHIDRKLVTARLWIENLTDAPVSTAITVRAFEKQSGRAASKLFEQRCDLGPHGVSIVEFDVAVNALKLWSPNSPFLYELLSTTRDSQGRECDAVTTTFGMREFKIVGADFYLNGRKVFLRGSNIAFHRFLSDKERRLLPWSQQWIKKVLIEIPKQHNFNFFRNHLGQMYNRWYDLADEGGILLQNEWMFWPVTGTREQIIKEFTQWLRDNWNHPSIVIWDPLNESTSEVVQRDIVPLMKKLDPTRPWDGVDFVEDHPYIYSLGPVLIDRHFGFSRALSDIENSASPSMINEYLWWWIDKDGQPSWLTREVVSRWLGENYTPQDLLEHQSFLATELTELFRRMRVRAIQPFVYLSANAGPTAHWFQGNIADLHPKPLLPVLKNLFEPFAVSVELWDRHFSPGEQRAVNIYVLNDDPVQRAGEVRYGITGRDGQWIHADEKSVVVNPGDRTICSATITFPTVPGTYFVRAELVPENAVNTTSFSQKIAHVIAAPELPASLQNAGLVVQDTGGEITTYLLQRGLKFEEFGTTTLIDQDLLVVGPGEMRSQVYQDRLSEISSFVRSGHSLILLEPEFGCSGSERLAALEDFFLFIKQREDRDRGGYDSYVFATDFSHPIWRDLRPEHLKMFNGGLGGEIISQHQVTPLAPRNILVRSGINLRVIAAAEMPYGNGAVVFSRLQIRGRLLSAAHGGTELFDRRPDPVAQRHLINLLAHYHQARAPALTGFDVTRLNLVNAVASSEQGANSAISAIDGLNSSRWESTTSDPQWLMVDCGTVQPMNRVAIHWEPAFASAYKIELSDDGVAWREVFHTTSGQGGVETIHFPGQKARYLRLFGIKRATQWAYSLWELSVHLDSKK